MSMVDLAVVHGIGEQTPVMFGIFGADNSQLGVADELIISQAAILDILSDTDYVLDPYRGCDLIKKLQTGAASTRSDVVAEANFAAKRIQTANNREFIDPALRIASMTPDRVDTVADRVAIFFTITPEQGDSATIAIPIQ